MKNTISISYFLPVFPSTNCMAMTLFTFPSEDEFVSHVTNSIRKTVTSHITKRLRISFAA